MRISSLGTLATLLLTMGCYVPVRDISLGTVDAGSDVGAGGGGGGDVGGGGGQTGGGTAGGTSTGGGTGGGATGGGGGGSADGDATCDQSACLTSISTPHFGPTYALRATGTSVLALGDPYAVGLLQIDPTDASSEAFYEELAKPLRADRELRVHGDFAYLLTYPVVPTLGEAVRVHLGTRASQQLTTAGNNTPGIGSGFDVTDTHFVYATANFTTVRIVQFALADTDPVASTLVTLATGEDPVRLRVTASSLWWVTPTGLYRAPRSGGAPTLVHAGDFRRLEVTNDADVWVSGPAGLAHWTPNGATTAYAQAVDDFVLARGSWFVAVHAGLAVKLLNSTGTVVLEGRDAYLGGTAALEVTQTHFFLATTNGLLMKSDLMPVATCGCTQPAVVLPAAVQACARLVCGTSESRTSTFISGTFAGDALYGVFQQPGTSDHALTRLRVGFEGVGLTYPVTRPSAVVSGGPTTLFTTGAGGLSSVDLTRAESLGLESGLSTPLYEPATAPMLAADATHVYGVNLLQGLLRVSRSGAPAETIYAVPRNLGGVRLDANNAYTIDGNRVMRVPKAGGAAVVLASGALPASGFDVAEGHVYFMTARGLERVRVGGGFKTLVATYAQLQRSQLTHLHLQGRDLVAAAASVDGTAIELIRIDLATRQLEVLLRVNDTIIRGVVVSDDGYALSGEQGMTFVPRGCCNNP